MDHQFLGSCRRHNSTQSWTKSKKSSNRIIVQNIKVQKMGCETLLDFFFQIEKIMQILSTVIYVAGTYNHTKYFYS